MKLPTYITSWVFEKMCDLMDRRKPDVFIGGGAADPYMIRYHLIRRNPFFNIYLHDIRRSDDARALHDHPWFNMSFILAGGYTEHTIAAGGIHHKKERGEGDVIFRSPWTAHRLELPEDHYRPVITLFITGPRVRKWGFHCAEKGWVYWENFSRRSDPGQIGRGCD